MNVSLAREIQACSRAYWKDRTGAGHRHSDNRWFQLYGQELLAMIPRGGTLLDVGCGACELTTHLAGAFDTIVAIDFSDSMLAVARKRVDREKLSQINVMKGQATQFPIAANSVDVVLAYGVVQYCSATDLQAHLSECARVLKPGGRICWGLVPNARLRRLWYAGALTNPRPSLVQMIRRSLRMQYRWWSAIRKGDLLWDDIGSWFIQDDLRKLCDRAGFSIEFRNCWYYEYRFHALLGRKEEVIG
jgi:ubiquinone/menaquinone biosynthesis C-methylase UbiE